MTAIQVRLRQYGLWLFLLGLLLGFIVPVFANRSLILGVHTAALIGGTFLLALAAHWPAVHLSPRGASVAAHAFALALYGLDIGLALLATQAGASERSSIQQLGFVLNIGSALTMSIALLVIMTGFAKTRRT